MQISTRGQKRFTKVAVELISQTEKHHKFPSGGKQGG